MFCFLKCPRKRVKAIAKQLADDADMIRNALAMAISSSHPNRPNAISDSEYRSCRAFLSNFSNIYTLNYDLLLYWALMSCNDDRNAMKCNDGFHQPASGSSEYVVWDVGDVNGQNIFYLHGALHIFDVDSEVQKYTWCNTGIPLVEQVREALKHNRYPIYVAEGVSETKMQRIQHSAFLGRALRSFVSIGNALFVYGHSFANNDEHVLKLIGQSKVNALYVSIFGDLESKGNRHIITRANAIKDDRRKARSRDDIEVHFFDAASAKIWK